MWYNYQQKIKWLPKWSIPRRASKNKNPQRSLAIFFRDFSDGARNLIILSCLWCRRERVHLPQPDAPQNLRLQAVGRSARKSDQIYNCVRALDATRVMLLQTHLGNRPSCHKVAHFWLRRVQLLPSMQIVFGACVTLCSTRRDFMGLWDNRPRGRKFT